MTEFLHPSLYPVNAVLSALERDRNKPIVELTGEPAYPLQEAIP